MQALWYLDENTKKQTLLYQFCQKFGHNPDDQKKLHQWSIHQKEWFWEQVWDFGTVIGEKGVGRFEAGDHFTQAKYFPNAQLNFAENMLRQRDATAIMMIDWDEAGYQRSLNYKEVCAQVSLWQQYFSAHGLKQGESVAAMLPNSSEAIIVFLAVVSLGGVWSSASPDFGAEAVLDRFGQIAPKFLIATKGYTYNQKYFDCEEKLARLKQELPSVKACLTLEDKADYLAHLQPKPLLYPKFSFHHPLVVVFSSGTTGKPKCIVHRCGGVLLQHLKEHQLHSNIKPEDKTFYFSTLGWMMWNWHVSMLASHACLVLYDGAPMLHDGRHMLRLMAKEQLSFFGTSAKFIDVLAQNIPHPNQEFDFTCLRTIASTGSPLSAEGFDYIYQNIKADVHLASISGGTDLLSCFVLGNPLLPVYRGQIQGPGLGMDVAVFDETGKAVVGEKGELVCQTPFPSQPLCFWGDEDGTKYKNSYFSTHDTIWYHGDFCEETKEGGFIIYGRSDATLNPGGVRIGTAEIYRQVEHLDEVVESLVIGQSWQNDVRIILFVVLKENIQLDEALIQKIKQHIRTHTTPRHVPQLIFAVPDIPRTKSGKITELSVKHIFENQPVKNKEALANPSALAVFYDIAKTL